MAIDLEVESRPIGLGSNVHIGEPKDRGLAPAFDVWLSEGVVWATAHGPLDANFDRTLTLRAVAVAQKAANWRILFDYRRAVGAPAAPVLSDHVDLMRALRLPKQLRAALLCQKRSTDGDHWASALKTGGHSAAVFTSDERAVDWLISTAHPTERAASNEIPGRPVCLGEVKSQLHRLVVKRQGAPRRQTERELKELMDWLLVQAKSLGVDLHRVADDQTRLRAATRPRLVRKMADKSRE